MARLTFGGIIPGGPGSDKGSARRLNVEASWFIRCEDSNIASEDRLSSVTKSTKIKLKVIVINPVKGTVT